MALLVMLLVLALPVAEILALIEIGSRIGAIRTIVLLLLGGMAGAALVRWQGIRAIRRAQETMRAGKPLGEPLLDGLILLAAGVLFLFPGFVSDALAILILLPGIRWLLRKGMARWARGAVRDGRVTIAVSGSFQVGGGRRDGGAAPDPPRDRISPPPPPPIADE